MLLRAIYSYQQTPCQDMYLHIYQDYVASTKLETLTDVQSQIPVALDQEACRR